MKGPLRHTLAIAVALSLATHVSLAAGAPIPPPPIAPAATAADSSQVDAPTRRVLELQQSVADVQAEQVAIDNRLVVTSRLILEQSSALDRANEELRAAQEAFNERVIAMYKFSDYDTVSILLDSSSWSDFVSRLSVLARVLDTDRLTLEEVSLVASQAQFQAGQLEELRAQDVELTSIREERARIMQNALTEQQALRATLKPSGRVVVDTQARVYRSTRARWKAASIPIGTRIRKVPGRVLDYPDRTYLVSEFHYSTYRTTGVAYRAVCSWYGADFNGRGTASGQVYNMEDFTCAHKTLPFGTWLALTRYDSKSKTYKRIIVVVNDRGPYIERRDIDLSKAAAEALAMAGAGVADVSVEVVTPTK